VGSGVGTIEAVVISVPDSQSKVGRGVWYSCIHSNL